jgi:nucleoside transporter
MESGQIRARLSAMMFGQYIIIGAWAVPLATYLMAKPADGGLGFSPSQTSWIYSATAFVGLLAPLFLGLLADRLFAAQKLLAFLHLAGSAILFAAARFCEARQEAIFSAADPQAASSATFAGLMALMIANAFVVVLTIALSNVTAFRNLKEPKKYFGGIRLFGTVAWIVINISIDLFANAISPLPLYVGSALSLMMSLYSFTLPHTPPTGQAKGVAESMGLPALNMFRQRDFSVLVICAMCMAAVQQFYSVYTNPFLADIQVKKPVALQTIAQFSEVLCMLAMPYCLMRWGMKVTLAVGVFGWIVRNAIFATGWLPAIVVVGLPLHGMCYTFFFVVANVFVDRHAPGDLRASAQGIFTFVSSGVGTLIGNFLGAAVLESQKTEGVTNWTWFWLVPAAGSAIAFVGFIAMFRDSHDAHDAPRIVTPKPNERVQASLN